MQQRSAGGAELTALHSRVGLLFADFFSPLLPPPPLLHPPFLPSPSPDRHPLFLLTLPPPPPTFTHSSALKHTTWTRVDLFPPSPSTLSYLLHLAFAGSKRDNTTLPVPNNPPPSSFFSTTFAFFAFNLPLPLRLFSPETCRTSTNLQSKKNVSFKGRGTTTGVTSHSSLCKALSPLR